MNEQLTFDTKLESRLRVLAEFRSALRQFLHFSEEASSRAGLHPQQYQLLLQIAGAAQRTSTTIAYASERLALRHNSVVELSQRCEDDGLIRRVNDAVDRRRVVLRITPKGLQRLEALAEDHARELQELAPQLIQVLTRIRRAGERRSGKTKGTISNEI